MKQHDIYKPNSFNTGCAFSFKIIEQDKEGNKRYTTEIIASKMQMLGSRDSYDNTGGGAGFRNNEIPPGPEFSGSQDDDIPF